MVWKYSVFMVCTLHCPTFHDYFYFCAGNFEIVRRCYERHLNCTGFFHVNGEWKKVPLGPILVCQSDTNECINDSNIRSDSSTGGSGTMYNWISLLLGSCIFSIFNAMVWNVKFLNYLFNWIYNNKLFLKKCFANTIKRPIMPKFEKHFSYISI